MIKIIQSSSFSSSSSQNFQQSLQQQQQNGFHQQQNLQILPQQINQQPQNQIQQPQQYQQQYQQQYSTLDFDKMGEIEFIYKIPDTHVGGSVDKIPRIERLLDMSSSNQNTYKFFEHEILWSEGADNLFLEIMSNSGDNIQRSRARGVDPKEIIVTMDNTRMTVKNFGIPIPVAIHPKFNELIPEFLFGDLRSSSNYKEDRKDEVAGRNGHGGKLTNIFSTVFSVKVGDPFNKKEYSQTWRNNMGIKETPIITEYTGEPYVEVSYILDFKRFGYESYPPEVFPLVARHAVDLSFTCKIPVIVNGIKFDASDIYSYAKLVWGDKIEHSIVHHEYADGVEVINKKIGNSTVPVAKNPLHIPNVEIIIIDTPDNGFILSFANGKVTREGGVHVDTALKIISDKILAVVNDDKKEDKKGKKKEKAFILTPGDVKRHISAIICCRVVQPKYDSQVKNKLKSPKPKITIDDKILKPILKWDIIARLYAELEAKQFKALEKTDGKKKRHIDDIVKLTDANFAGKEKSHECTLILTEGKSAGSYATSFIGMIPDGRNYFGIYPMKGKPLNVMKAGPQQIADNDEIRDLKKTLGLREGIDYTNNLDFATLRYGRCLIAADSDDDGKHIVGLILLYFYCHYPSLLARGFVIFLRTPLIRIWKGNDRIKFYTEKDYLEWRDRNPNYENYKHKYYKGLATSTNQDVKEEAVNPKSVVFVYDDTASQYFHLVFDEGESDARKEWIAKYAPILGIEDYSSLPISQFINQEVIKHSLANIARCIPSLDGLKESQRKAIWGSYDEWGAKVGSNNAEECKVVDLASGVSKLTSYHYGPTSLMDAINMMALDFPGSNNLPYFTQDGQFGTRFENGDDVGAARYCYVRPQWWWNLIFKKDDHDKKEGILKFVVDEGKEREPELMLPIIPLFLVNGCNGIATGYSTYIPNYNPLDLCNWIKRRINNLLYPPLMPWYRGFIGNITIREKKPKAVTNGMINGGITILPSSNPNINIVPNNVYGGSTIIPIDVSASSSSNSNSDDILEPDEVNINSKTKYTVVTSGVFNVEGRITYVTELPIGRSINKYKQWLTKLRSEKVIKDFKDNSSSEKIFFTIENFPNPSVKNLKLEKSYGLSNFVLLDEYGKPKKYETVEKLLEEWYVFRYVYFEKRKAKMIDGFNKKINHLNDKMRFIRAVIDGWTQGMITGRTIVFMNKTKAIVHPQMDAMNLPHELLKSVSSSNYTEDEIIHLRDEINKIIYERDELAKKSPGDLWIADIDEFLAAYCRYYKVSNNNVSINIVQ